MIARKIAYNVVFNSFAKVLSTVLALVSIGLITRYLGRDGFGDYATVLAFFSLFGAILDLGLYSVATREISRKDADEERIIGNVFTLRLFSSLAVLVIAPILIIFLPYSAEVKNGILIVAVSYIASSSYMVLNGIFQKNLRMDKVAITELTGKVIQVAIVALAYTNDWGFNAIMWAFFANMVFAFVLVLLLSRKYIKFSLSFDFQYWKKFLKMSFPMGVSAFVTFLYFKMDTIMLSILKGSEAVGIYNMAYKIIENITFFPAMIVGLVLPLFSVYIFTDKSSFKKIADKVAKIFFLLSVPLVIGTLFLAENVIDIIGGSEFLISADILRLLIFALAFIFFGHFFNVILLAANLQMKLMKILAFCAFLNISLNLVLISIYSYTGAAAVSVITELTVVLLTAYLTKKYVGYSFSAKGWERIIFSGIAMAIFLFIFKEMNFFVLVFGSMAVYVFFLWLSRAITIQEIKSVVVSA